MGLLTIEATRRLSLAAPDDPGLVGENDNLRPGDEKAARVLFGDLHLAGRYSGDPHLRSRMVGPRLDRQE